MKRINRIAPIQISAETHDSILKNIKQGVDKASEVAKTMDLQQGVRESVHDRYRVVNRERRPGRGKPGGNRRHHLRGQILPHV